MTVNRTTLLDLPLPVTGTESGTWGDTTNNGLTQYLDIAIAGTLVLSTDADVTLTSTEGDSSATNIGATTAQYAILRWTATGSTTRNITALAQSKTYVVINATGGTQSIVLRGAGPTTGVTIISGEKAHCVWNGSDFVKVSSSAAAGGSNTQIQFNNSGNLGGSSNLTWNGTTLSTTGLTASSTVTMSGATTNIALGTSQTSGTWTAGGAAQTGTITLDRSTKAHTLNIGTGATENATTKTINIGTAGVSGSTTNLTYGSGVTGSTTTHIWNSGGTEGMRLNSTGLGIGTDSPSFTAGSGVMVFNSTQANFRLADGTNYVDLLQNSGAGYLWNRANNFLSFGTNNTERMRIDSSGNVGIGTSSPEVKLNVAGDILINNNSYLYGENSVGGNSKLIGRASDDTLYVGDSTYNNPTVIQTGNNHVAINTNGSERARIDSGGNLLVNTTTSNSSVFRFKVQTATNVCMGVSSATAVSGALTVNAIDDANGANVPLDFRSSAIHASEGIATTATGANAVFSSGENNRFYRSTSALKYKQDIRDIESIDISKFRPVRYKSKCENDDQTKDHFGIIADEVHEAGITELVSYGVDGEIEGFQYDRLTVVLLKHCQEQQAIIEQLKARLDAANL